MSTVYFRANVGACVLDAQGRVLALQRKGTVDAAWQMPQGGIEDHETSQAAVLRELAEETGLRAEQVLMVAEHPDWLAYELPAAYRNPKVGWGQVQKWFVLRLLGDALPQPDGEEFQACAWLAPAELLQQVVAFRRSIYERVLAFAFASLGKR